MNLFGIVQAVGFQQSEITVDRPPGFQVTDVGTIISGAVGTAFIVAGLIMFGLFVFGGIRMITASGDKSQSQQGREAITGAALGFAIVAAAFALVLLLQYIFGYNVLGGITVPTFF